MLQISAAKTSVFDHRDMRLVIPARALSVLGDSVALVVLSLAIAQSGEPARMTMMLVAFSLPLFALAPLAGRIVDEYDSRNVLVAAGALQVVGSLGLVLTSGFPAMLGCVLILQAGQSVTNPSWQALVPRIVGDALVGKAIGLQQSLSAVAGLAGAAIGGVLYDVVGYHRTLLLDTATFALLVAVGAVVSTRRGRRFDAAAYGENPAQTMPTKADRQGGWTVIKGDDLLRLLVPALWLFILAAEAPNVIEIFLIRDDLHASPAVYGLVMAGFMLGQISGPLLAGRISSDTQRVTWTAIAAGIIGLLMAAIGVSTSVWMVLPLFVVVGVAAGALNALVGTLIVTRPADHVRGRVLATLNGTARGFSVIALVLGGLGGQLIGARSTFVICGALSAVVALVVLRTRAAAETSTRANAPEPATMEA